MNKMARKDELEVIEPNLSAHDDLTLFHRDEEGSVQFSKAEIELNCCSGCREINPGIAYACSKIPDYKNECPTFRKFKEK